MPKRSYIGIGVVGLLAALSARSASATPLTLTNGNFQQGLTGWTGTAGDFAPTAAQFANTGPTVYSNGEYMDGTNLGYANSTYLAQDLGTPDASQVGVTYNITFGLGYRGDGTGDGTNFHIWFRRDAAAGGSTNLSELYGPGASNIQSPVVPSAPVNTPFEGTLIPSTISYTIASADVGHQIWFVVDGSSQQTNFDNITMTPEPASLSLLGLGCVGLLSRRRRRV